jgi:hypothetical protein
MTAYRILPHLPGHRNVVDDRAASLRRDGNETTALVEAISRADRNGGVHWPRGSPVEC